MHRLGELGIDFGAFLTGLADMMRAQLAVTLGSRSVDVSERARAALEERVGRISAPDLLRMLAAIGELEQRFRKSGQQQLLVETLLVRFALLDRTVAIEDVLRTLGDGGAQGRPRSGNDAPAPPGTPTRQGNRSNSLDDQPRRAANDAAPPADRPVPPPPLARDRAPAPRAAAPSLATPATGATVPTINLLTERWDDVVAAVRANRMVLAPFLEASIPSAVSAAGVLTVRAEDAPSAEALDLAKHDLLGIVKTIFPAIERVAITRPETGASAGPRRVTEEEIRTQRMASLRKRDPVLGAAIDALDLELLD
jgi:DNA polymerase-3 subunit gamma/tau